MDLQSERVMLTDLPVRHACLVEGCPCKDPRIISTRRAAFFADWARRHHETADRRIEPDPQWSDLFHPRHDASIRPTAGRRSSARWGGPVDASRPGW